MARKLRLFMSAFAIILGVSFVAGSFIFTDTLAKSFDQIMTGSVGDVIVRPVGTTSEEQVASTAITGTLVESLADVPGAERADGNITNFGTFVISSSGKMLGGQGAPGLAVNANDAPTAAGSAPATLVEGRWPTAAGEVALDKATAEKSGYDLGESVKLVSSGPTPMFDAKLVGVADFGSSLVGASVAIFDTSQAQRLFVDGKDVFSDAWVTAADGTSQEELRAAVANKLPKGLEAVTGDTAAAEAASEVQESLKFINTFLLVFAAVSLVVGSFLIVNTFSILVAQRSRELALLRALGARRKQVSRSVLFEAFVVGLIGSTVGLAFGALLALGIRALFGNFGLDLSGTSLVFAPRTAIAAYAVGMVVTLVAAYLPARRAGKVAPVAAMRDDVTVAEGSLRRRIWVGLGLTGAGVVALGVGLFADISKPIWFVGAGIFGVLIGVALTSPLVGRPVVALLGALYRRLFGTVGVMAQRNAERNPRRTAATASALMIGVTLVSMMSVFGASAKASLNEIIEQDLTSDYVVSNAVGTPFSPAVPDMVRAVPGVSAVASVRYDDTSAVKGEESYLAGFDVADLDAVGGPDMISGKLTDLTDSTVLLSEAETKERGTAVGDQVALTTRDHTVDLKVAGIYKDTPLLGAPYLVTEGTLAKLQTPPELSFTLVNRAEGTSAATVTRNLEKALADLPMVTVKDQDAFAEQQRKPIDQMLLMVYALLGLAVVIAVLGIINTLALSVIERTREFGLLRAVGLSRRQLRTMVRLESVVIALLGAALGVGLGIAFGVALQRAMADEGIQVLAIPAGQLVAFVGLAGVVGVLAAIWPGRRAAKLDILKAVSTE